MSVFKRIYMYDIKDGKVMYDFSTKRFISYNKPKDSPVGFTLLMLGLAPGMIGIMSLGSSRHGSESDPWGPKCMALKDRPDFWKILLAYLVASIILYIILTFIVPLFQESGGVKESNITNLSKVKVHYNNNLSVMVKMQGYGPEKDDDEYDAKSSRKHYFDEMHFGMVLAFLILVGLIIFTVYQEYLIAVIALSIQIPLAVALCLYSLTAFFQQRRVIKKYNLNSINKK